LILGASYGSLLGTKLVFAGHDVTLVCRAATAESINRHGVRVRLPVSGKDEAFELDSRDAAGMLTASAPNGVDPSAFDLVALAMQEPQYRLEGVRELLDRVATAHVSCMSVMNMPPPPYLRRIPGLDTDVVASCYTDATVWRNFLPEYMTLCSPDPQAFRLPDQPVNTLQVTLATNFKAARFDSDRSTAMLQEMQTDIEAFRYSADRVELPVKLKVHESLFVPLAKWPMLVTGNYRCVQKNAACSIRDAVHTDAAESRALYDWVFELCVGLGASPSDLVPFEKYAAAARDLIRPSSAARALFAGATAIERVDRLVQAIGAQKGMQSAAIDEIVARVDARLKQNAATALA